jgi:hypothetical protein
VGVGALALAPHVARAGEEESKSLFAEGRRLREAGKCSEAILSFRRALETWPEGLGALRNVAECEEQLGRYSAARRDYWDLRRAALQSNLPRYEGWDKDAESAYARLESKVPRLKIVVHAKDPSKVSVSFDGKPLDPRLVGVELERDIGTFDVQAGYGGATPVTERVALEEGARKTLTLEVPDLVAPVAHKAVAQGNPTLRTAGFVALGVGAASAIGTVVAIAVRGSALSSIEASCPSYETKPCPTALQGDASTGQTAATLANVLGGVAIAGLGAGVALVLVARPHASAQPTEKSAQAELMVTPTPSGALGTFGMRF